MGKKKSVVLMVLLTIVIIALCAITALPSFAIPNSVKKWNPAVKQYDFSADLGGGYYAYYYPEGVISEAEYEDNLATAEDRRNMRRRTYAMKAVCIFRRTKTRTSFRKTER